MGYKTENTKQKLIVTTFEFILLIYAAVSFLKHKLSILHHYLNICIVYHYLLIYILYIYLLIYITYRIYLYPPSNFFIDFYYLNKVQVPRNFYDLSHTLPVYLNLNLSSLHMYYGILAIIKVFFKYMWLHHIKVSTHFVRRLFLLLD